MRCARGGGRAPLSRDHVVAQHRPASLAVALAASNAFRLVWWLWGLGVTRGRGLGGRGLTALLTVGVGLAGAWTTADVLKLVFQWPRTTRLVLRLR